MIYLQKDEKLSLLEYLKPENAENWENIENIADKDEIVLKPKLYWLFAIYSNFIEICSP